MRHLVVLTIVCSWIGGAADLGAEPPTEIVPDLVYGHKDGLALTMDVFPPEVQPNGGAVLFVVSGGWFSRWTPPEVIRPLFTPYLERGYRVFAIRHGSSPRYGIADAVADVRRAVRFVRLHADAYGVDPERMAMIGMSAGGHLSLMIATTGDDGDPTADDPVERVSSRVATVAALVPPTDLRVLRWGAPQSGQVYRQFPALEMSAEEAAEVSPVLHISDDDAPALVISGGRDQLVPADHGRWVQAAFEEGGIASRLVVIEEADHGLQGEHRVRTMREIFEWLDAQLARQ